MSLDDDNNHYITGMKELKPGDLGYESPCSSSNSHAVLAEVADIADAQAFLRERGWEDRLVTAHYWR